ncbi:uncharacterized protein LOC104903773 [Beta vulgaris subsp. vulgaris]|uniref:uncharacterized protein LOC104903773 n=1 Tax=Beta vulgaris subsp. vulgaris TaxID=3555 RepID=UPI002036D08A|nr:uncharacterized protein LOC104903773 [Beta vulgaris subsp. vulgaris]
MPIPQSMAWALKKILSTRDIFEKGNRLQEFIVGEKFSIRKCYNQLNGDVNPVSWKRLICNNKASPKSIFITWLAVLNRLTTKVRLVSWQMLNDPSCPICQQENEDVLHLFIKCNYSATIWQKCLQILKCPRPIVSFMSEVNIAAEQCRRRHKKSQVYGMVFTDAVYQLWMQRNQKVFENKLVSPDQVVDNIIFNVACRCLRI